jgi:ribosomal subunit interface protein
MQINVQGKQMEIGAALRTHVTDKLEDMNARFFNHATDAVVTFSPEGHGHGLIRAHISIRIGRDIMVMGEAEENEAYLSFDVACAKVAKQLRRYKNRLRDRHDSGERVDALNVPYYVIKDEAEVDESVPQGDDPVTIAEMVTRIETLCVSDAVMRLDLANQTALLFRNAKNGEINLVYRRPDGNVGWIDPSMALQTSQGRRAQAAE